MKKVFWLFGIALMMLCPLSYLFAADDELDNVLLATDEPVPIQPATSDYWLGIECHPVMPDMRAQLNLPENQGIVVEGIVPDSPAAKAGLAKSDVILKVNDKKLADVLELVQTVNTVKDKEMKLEIIRDGQPKTLTITPVKRPEGFVVTPMPGGDIAAMQKWIERMQKDIGSGRNGPMRFWSFSPGVILPPGSLIHQPLPGNMSISITKNGDKPADIVVKLDKEKWEVTEKELDKLPEKVRPYVHRMLGMGTGPGGGVMQWIPEMVNPPTSPQEPGAMPAPDARFRWTPGPNQNAQPLNNMEKRIEKRLEEMKQRMEKMEKELHERFQGDKKPEPQPPVEKNQESAPDGKTL
jgi:membrane-associated protease RseP (regulator of RpoE activity)